MGFIDKLYFFGSWIRGREANKQTIEKDPSPNHQTNQDPQPNNSAQATQVLKTSSDSLAVVRKLQIKVSPVASENQGELDKSLIDAAKENDFGKIFRAVLSGANYKRLRDEVLEIMSKGPNPDYHTLLEYYKNWESLSLVVAAGENDVELIKFCRDKKPSIYAEHFTTAFLIAAMRNQTDVFEFMIHRPSATFFPISDEYLKLFPEDKDFNHKLEHYSGRMGEWRALLPIAIEEAITNDSTEIARLSIRKLRGVRDLRFYLVNWSHTAIYDGSEKLLKLFVEEAFEIADGLASKSMVYNLITSAAKRDKLSMIQIIHETCLKHIAAHPEIDFEDLCVKQFPFAISLAFANAISERNFAIVEYLKNKFIDNSDPLIKAPAAKIISDALCSLIDSPGKDQLFSLQYLHKNFSADLSESRIVRRLLSLGRMSLLRDFHSNGVDLITPYLAYEESSWVGEGFARINVNSLAYLLRIGAKIGAHAATPETINDFVTNNPDYFTVNDNGKVKEEWRDLFRLSLEATMCQGGSPRLQDPRHLFILRAPFLVSNLTFDSSFNFEEAPFIDCLFDNVNLSNITAENLGKAQLLKGARFTAKFDTNGKYLSPSDGMIFPSGFDPLKYEMIPVHEGDYSNVQNFYFTDYRKIIQEANQKNIRISLTKTPMDWTDLRNLDLSCINTATPELFQEANITGAYGSRGLILQLVRNGAYGEPDLARSGIKIEEYDQAKRYAESNVD